MLYIVVRWEGAFIIPKMKTLKTPPLFYIYTNASFLCEEPGCGTNRDCHTLYQ
jgi:hypothetical protein